MLFDEIEKAHPDVFNLMLRRLIQREVDDRIADLFVTGDLGDGDGVRVDAVEVSSP